jgi:hypothetical protein
MVSRKSHLFDLELGPDDTLTCVTLKVCADKVTADKVRMQVRRWMDERVRLVELDFQPSLRENSRMALRDMEFNCRG